MAKKNGKSKQKLTKAQREARLKAAEEREARAKAAQERAARTKKIFTIVICVVLVLALGLPTVGLALCSNPEVAQQEATQQETTQQEAAQQETAQQEIAQQTSVVDISAQVEGDTSADTAQGGNS